jgi:hypothetical protein
MAEGYRLRASALRGGFPVAYRGIQGRRWRQLRARLEKRAEGLPDPRPDWEEREASRFLVFLYVPLALSENGGATLAAVEDAPELIYLATRLFATGFGFSLLLFAGFCALIGVLILRSRLLPRTIGAMMIVAGICYVVNTLALIVSPRFFERINPTILLPILLAELSLALWLLLKGIADEAK